MAYYVFNGAKCLCQTFGVSGSIKKNNKVSSQSSDGIITIGDFPSMDKMGKCASPLNPLFAEAAAAQQLPPCMPSWCGKWINTGICRVKLVSGLSEQSALLDNAILVCKYGGLIKIQSPSNNLVDNQRSLDDFNFSLLENSLDNSVASSAMSAEAAMMVKKSSADVYQEMILNASQNSSKENVEELQKSDNKKAEASEKRKVLYSPCEDSMVCSGECPKGLGESCPFKMSIPIDMVVLKNRNSSSELKSNFQDSNPNAEELDKKMRECFVGDKFECVPQYHHIIPGNECLNTNKTLVTLANFYDYDVNNTENAIMLPSVKKVGKSATDMEFLEAKCMAMKKTGLQLHQGQHKYSTDVYTDNPEVLKNIKKFNNYQKKLKSYDTLVNEQLKVMATNMREEMFDSCRLEGGEEQFQKEKEAFISKMNALSADIKKRIMEFPHEKMGNNKDNYYVSYTAMAYDISKNGTAKEVDIIMNGEKKTDE